LSRFAMPTNACGVAVPSSKLNPEWQCRCTNPMEEIRSQKLDVRC